MGATSSVQSRLGLRSAAQLSDLLDGPRFSGNSGDHIPYPKVLDCSLANSGEDLRPTNERNYLYRFPRARHVTHSMSDRGGSQRSRLLSRQDSRHCDHFRRVFRLSGACRLSRVGACIVWYSKG